MEKFTCWEASSISETVFIDIGALSTSTDAVFLAAHTPARVRHQGPHVEAVGGGEVQVLSALLSDVGKHPSNSVIAITGTPGTGKSHIVRWVYAQIRRPRPEMHVLYVPREISSLKELLRSLIKGLPGDVGDEMLSRVDEAIGSATEQEIASRLRGAMVQALRWSFPPVTPFPEETADDKERRESRELVLGTHQSDGRWRGGLADMLDVPLIRDNLEREDGTLRTIAGSIVGTAPARDVGVARFVPDDLDPHGPGRIGEVRAFLSSIKTRPETALTLLQEALEKALPEFVGLSASSGETLESLFLNARTMLKESGRELVLLFEDLAQFGLIDGALFNQFLIQPTDDYTPLRVIFAITNAKWEERVPEGVQRRIRHQFEVLPIQESPEGASETDTSIRDFIARYLNLVRAGRTQVEEAWSKADDESRKSGSWIPNSCETREHGKRCRFADVCRPGFGSAEVQPIGNVGLFPFNEAALRRLTKKMGTSAGNPGRLLQTALEEVLVEAGPHIKNATYPDRRVEDLFYFGFLNSPPALSRGVPGEVGTRLLRANVIWGDDKQITTSAILDAFALPRLADNLAADIKAAEPTSTGDVIRPSTIPPTARQPLPLLMQVNAWSQRPNEFLESSVGKFREWLYDGVIDRLGLDQDLIHVEMGMGKELLDSVLVPYSFVFTGAEYGRTPGRGRLCFNIAPDEETVALLTGVLWFRHVGHWRPEDGSWAWPDGFSPDLLQRITNGYLQRWADEVHSTVVGNTVNPNIRDEVLALRAIAHQCLGGVVADPGSSGAINARPAPIGNWMTVEQAALLLLSEIQKSRWLSDLFAVRQSESADPQLVDTIGAHDAEDAAVADPWRTLTAVCGESRLFAAPLALAATRLHDAVGAAAQEQVQTVLDTILGIEETLEGADLAELAKAALEIGDRALSTNIFRPADGWGSFKRACNSLQALSSDWRSRSPITSNAGEHPASEAIRMQSWCRAVVAARKDLEVIRNSIAATTQEANHRLSGDLGATDLREDIINKAATAARAIGTIVRPAREEMK
jgi:hypothetical protein